MKYHLTSLIAETKKKNQLIEEEGQVPSKLERVDLIRTIKELEEELQRLKANLLNFNNF